MICEKCGVILPDGLEYCTNCGALLDIEEEESRSLKPNKFFKILFSIILIALVSFGAYKVTGHIRMNMFHDNMICRWRRYSEDGIVSEFNISESTIEYVVEYGSARKTLAIFDYDVVSPDEIIVSDRFEVYKVKFNKDKSKMTITPAITCNKSSEDWFYLE